MGKLISHIFRAIDFCVIKLCSLMPLREKTIVLRSIPDFSDNAHAFYDYMCREHGEEGYTLVWLVVDPSEYADRASKHRRFVRCEGNGLLLKRDFYLAVAKYVIFTHSAPIRKWRRGQLFIGTTHSASQLKGEDVRQQSERRIVFPDYKLRCGQDGLERMMQTSGMPADRFLVLGMPRLDLLFRHRECVTTLFPGVQPKLTVIALETYKQSSKGWQDSEAQSSYGLNIIEDQQTLTALDKALAQRGILLIVKPHPLQDLSHVEMNRLESIRFVTDRKLADAGVQLYQLVENCGALLTDYSSIYYDYLFLDRPIGFMIGDLEAYKRGFIIDDPLSEMTGPKIRSVLELIAFMDDVLAGKDDYRQERAALKDRVFKYQDDKNCERLFNFLKAHGK